MVFLWAISHFYKQASGKTKYLKRFLDPRRYFDQKFHFIFNKAKLRFDLV